MTNAKIANERLEALHKREAILKTAIAQERVRLQKRNEKDAERVASVIGGALVRYAEKASDFRLMISQVLQSAELTDSDRSFLKKRGWL